MVYEIEKETPYERIRREWLLKHDKDWIISHYRSKFNVVMLVFMIVFFSLLWAIILQEHYNLKELDKRLTNEQAYQLSDEYCNAQNGFSLSVVGILEDRKGIAIECFDDRGIRLSRKVIV